MDIKVGKFYKTRSGNKAKIYEIFDNYYIGAVYFETSTLWVPLVWSKGQNIASSEGSLYDIVSEWTEPHPAESWEVDKKILVSDDGEIWANRHFSKFENGAVYTWPSGLTSWSNANIFPSYEEEIPWKYAKPAEEE